MKNHSSRGRDLIIFFKKDPGEKAMDKTIENSTKGSLTAEEELYDISDNIILHMLRNIQFIVAITGMKKNRQRHWTYMFIKIR